MARFSEPQPRRRSLMPGFQVRTSSREASPGAEEARRDSGSQRRPVQFSEQERIAIMRDAQRGRTKL